MSGDLYRPADVKLDVTDIQFPDGYFDVVYCSHVLEHVPDDRRAIRELLRVVKPGGWAIIMVPITVDATVEDLGIVDPAERARRYGQEDHVRRYGVDFIDRLRTPAFGIEVARAPDFMGAEEIKRLGVGVPAAGEIFHCTRLH